MRETGIVIGVLLCVGMVRAVEPKGFDFAAEAAKGNVRLVGGVYTNASEAARQVTADADGLRFRFDPARMAPGPRWCTVDVRGELQPGDWLGSRVRLVMRRRPFRNVTKQMAVNFTDRDGETFQYLPSQVEEMPSENLLACTFEVRNAHNGCWGGGDKANKTPDPPLRFTSLNGHFAAGGRFAEMTLVRFEVLPPRGAAGTRRCTPSPPKDSSAGRPRRCWNWTSRRATACISCVGRSPGSAPS